MYILYVGIWLVLLHLADSWGFHHAEWLAPHGRPFSWALAVLAIVALVLLPGKRQYRVPIGLLAAGFLDNLYCYAEYGRFADFIPMHFWYSSPADLVITVGCAWLFFAYGLYKKELR